MGYTASSEYILVGLSSQSHTNNYRYTVLVQTPIYSHTQKPIYLQLTAPRT